MKPPAILSHHCAARPDVTSQLLMRGLREREGRPWLTYSIGGLALLLLPLLAACGGASPTPTPTATAPDLNLVLAVGDIGVGEQRIVFALLDNNRTPVRVPQVDYKLSFVEQKEDQQPSPVLRSQGSAPFRPWPAGPGGVYVTRMDLDKAGTWTLEASVPKEGGGTRLARSFFTVQERSSSVPVGEPALRSNSKTIRDVGGRVEDLEQISTAVPADPDLYQLTIAKALDTGKPLLVYFGTPAFCETATCGPQYDVIAGLKEKYRDQMNFIHVEIWDNPLEMREDRTKGRISPTVQEWGLISEPMTYIVGSSGIVFDKCEAFTSAEELEPVIQQVLQ